MKPDCSHQTPEVKDSRRKFAVSMMPLLLLACVLAGLVCGSVASASQFVNGSFEDPATYFKVLYTGESIPGWTVLGGTVDLNGYGLWQPSNGEMSVDMVGTPARGAIAQTLQFDTAEPHYLTFDLSRNPNINYTTASMGVWWKAAGSDEFAGLGLFAFDKLNQAADMMWQQMGTATFTAGPGPATFVFEALSGGDWDRHGQLGWSSPGQRATCRRRFTLLAPAAFTVSFSPTLLRDTTRFMTTSGLAACRNQGLWFC